MTTQQRREAATLLHERGVSMRRSCVLVRVSRNAVGYVKRRPSDDALVMQIDEVQKKYPCYGYRRTHAELTKERKGMLNHKRVHRVWRERGLQHPVRRSRKRSHDGHVPLQAMYANHVWTYDFVHDATYEGRRLRFLTLVDEHNRRGLAVEVRRSFTATHVIDVLEQVIARVGAPAFLRSDNGSEFVAAAMKAWLERMDIQTHYIEPASPWQNAYGESFNATLRREHLNRNVFTSLREAQVLTDSWLHYYNHERLHTSLGFKTPESYYLETATGGPVPDLGALPPNPQGLPLAADPQGRHANGATRIAPPHSCVFGPVPALGSLPSVALSSGRATNILRPWIPPC